MGFKNKEFETMTNKEFEAETSKEIESSPPPFTTASGTEVFDVNYVDWQFNIHIINSAGQKLFTAQRGSSSTHLEFTNKDNRIIGHTKRSNLTSKIEVEVVDASGQTHAFEIHNSRGVLGGSPKYTSPAFSNEVTWKNKAMASRIIYTLVDGRGMAVAKFQSDPRSRIGKLELSDDVAGEDKLNEVAVTLLTLLQRKMKNIQDALIVAVAT